MPERQNEFGEIMLADFFEPSALIKVLDFLLDEWETDFSQAEIARETGLNWKTVHLLMPRVEKLGLARQTRVISRAKMYRVNSASAAFKAVKEIDRCVNAAFLGKAVRNTLVAEMRGRNPSLSSSRA